MIKDPNQRSTSFIRGLNILVLIIAGESIFLMPFVLARIFRPTFLEVFGINNFELGTAFSVYGIVALISYFAGGPLADMFSTKLLLSFAMLITSLSGFYFSSIPSIESLTILYGFWGMTTILLFWAALIKATRQWGGEKMQGFAYGILDGGRGLFTALLASISVAIFVTILPDGIAMATISDKKSALSTIIFGYSIFMVLVSVLVYFTVSDSSSNHAASVNVTWGLEKIKKAIKIPSVWYHALIILCAYVGYKCTDDFSLMASDSFGYDDVASANIGTISFWIRPVIAIAAGMLADRLAGSSILIWGFIITILGSTLISMGIARPGIILFLLVGITSIGIYATRGIYFALFEEAKIPINITGTTIGIVSVIGFLPDVFMGPLMGILIDNNPGPLGHQYLFGVLAIFSIIGLLSTFAFRRYAH